MSVAEAVFKRFHEEPVLVGMLPGGVHTVMALKGETPRLILGFEFSTIGNGTIRGGFVNADIYDKSNDLDSMEQIRDRIIQLVDRVPLQSEESGPTLRLYLESDGPESDPNTEIGVWTVTFGVRFLRDRLQNL